MENAGRGAAEVIAGFLGGRPARGARVAIVCGKGGNGGDGFVVARWLRRRGWTPSVWLTTPAGEITGNAAKKLTALRGTGVRPRLVTDDKQVAGDLSAADAIVNGLLGTGAQGTPTGLTAR